MQKVIELLDNLKAKVEKDVAAETKAMDEYLAYCDFEAKDTDFAIRTGEREIEDVGAVIIECGAKDDEYEAEISSISSEIASKESELAEAEQERATEHADFLASERDLLASGDEMNRAILTIKKDMSLMQMRGANPQPSAAMAAVSEALGKMVDAEWLDVASKKRLTKFLQQKTASEDSDSLSLMKPITQENVVQVPKIQKIPNNVAMRL